MGIDIGIVQTVSDNKTLLEREMQFVHDERLKTGNWTVTQKGRFPM